MCDANPAAPGRSPCTFCGTSLKNKASLSRHLRTSCKAKPPDATTPVLQCPECNRDFKNLIGLSQHRRQAHKDQYNNDALNEVRASKSGRNIILWPPDTTRRMATLEASYTGNQVLNFLARKFPDRTKNAISCKRRRDSYKELVTHLREEPIQRDETSTSSPTTATAATSPPLISRSPSIKGSPPLSASTLPMSPEITTPQSNAERPSLSLAPPPPFPPLSPPPNPFIEFCISLSNDPDSGLLDIDKNLTSSLISGDRNLHYRIDEWFDLAFPDNIPKHQPKPKSSINLHRTGTRQERYHYTQNLFRRDTARCAREILDGCLGATQLRPDTERIFSHYSDIFNNPGSDSLPINYASPAPDWLMDDTAIKVDEVKRALDSTKSVSKGPDNISMKGLREFNINRLTFIFNIILATSHIPLRLKSCRTTLIPKGSPSINISQWRPITISSNVSKTLNRIILNRLASVPLNKSQRGFSNIDGCLGSNLILQQLIRHHRDKAAPHVVLAIDISKAFDTIPHGAISRALSRFRIPVPFIQLIMESYKDVSTTISAGGSHTQRIPIRRGVKQGDPLSPLLFNMVLDELLCSLPLSAGLHLPSGNPIPALAYADDIILLGKNRKDADLLLSATTNFFRRLDMHLNIAKCTSLECVRVPRKKKLAVVTDVPYTIGGIPLTTISPSAMFKYLGVHYGYQGATLPTLSDLNTGLERIRGAALKPNQRLLILKTYLLPRFFYGLQNPKTTGLLLRSASRMVRGHLKRFLHLPTTATSSYLHAALRDGGLGVTDFSTAIPSILLRRLDNLSINGADDQALKEVLEGDLVSRLRLRLLNILKSNVYSKTAVANSWRRDLETSVSGNGLHQGGSSNHSSAWISRPPPFWSGKEFTKAIALRGNLLPTVGIVSNPPDKRRCRAGCPRQESLSHVLQRCPATHLERIRRHDFIVNDLHKMGSRRGWSVAVEPHIRGSDGLLRKPDLIFSNDEKIIISDVQVVWEGPRPMTAAFQNKQNYYSTPEFLSSINSKFPGRPVYVFPFIIGARGTWSSSSWSLLTALNIQQNAARDLILRTISGSIKIHESFARAVWSRR